MPTDSADGCQASRIHGKYGKPPPGPRALPVVGALLHMRHNPLQFMLDTVRRYGDIARIDLGFKRAFLLAHPEFIKYTLQDHRKNFRRGPATHWLRPLWGEGLVTSDGDLWERQRKLVQPAFHHKRLAALSSSITAETQVMLDRWEHAAERGEPFDVASEMKELTTRILLRAMFGNQAVGELQTISHVVTALLRDANHRMSSLIPQRLDFLTLRSLRRLKAIKFLDEAVYRIISERRRTEEDRGDMLSMLLLARDQGSGQGMDDQQARDEVMTLFLAGRESVGAALAWTWYLLSKNPQVERRLKAELDEVLTGRAPTFADLSRLTYTKMVIEESLRLYPPAYKLSRQAVEDDEIGGYAIPAGSRVILSPWVTHRLPHFWQDPERFDPERFSPEGAEGRPRYAYFPFGGGPRSCAGFDFALMELHLIVAAVAQCYRLDLVPGHRVEPQALLTLQPRRGVVIVAHRQ